MTKDSTEAQKRAEATFKKKETQAREGAKAMQEYETAGKALRERTERLRALRLAKEAAEARVEGAKTIAKSKPVSKKGVRSKGKKATLSR